MFYNLQESKTLIYTLLAKLAGVYMILNRNGKYYIGSAVDLAKRVNQHIMGIIQILIYNRLLINMVSLILL